MGVGELNLPLVHLDCARASPGVHTNRSNPLSARHPTKRPNLALIVVLILCYGIFQFIDACPLL